MSGGLGPRSGTKQRDSLISHASGQRLFRRHRSRLDIRQPHDAIKKWAPGGAHDASVSSDAFKSQLRFAARISHHAYTNLGGPDYGIRWLERYRPSNEYREPGTGMFADLYPYEDVFGPGEHPFPTTYCGVSVTMIVEPATLLRRVIEDVQHAGGSFVVRNFADKEELLSLDQPVIFNCTGLGARVATMVAPERMRIDGVFSLGYPLHPAGKPEKAQAEQLFRVITPMLFVQGERARKALRGVLAERRPRGRGGSPGGPAGGRVSRSPGRTPAGIAVRGGRHR